MQNITHIVNLDLPAGQRWEFLTNYKVEVNALLRCYLNDFEGAHFIFDHIGMYRDMVISTEYQQEINFIASISDFTPDQVLIANLYYDLLKFYLGCSAFAVKSGETMLHARNLDWWTDNNILSEHSCIFDFQRNGKTVFKTVGWFGFIGALSGTKPGKFSITLNAVSNNDSAEITLPVTFLLRDVLDRAGSYGDAKKQLAETTIASDCLLLLSGIEAGEMVVIERTPQRSAVRKSTEPHILVTNDYKRLENDLIGESVLQKTSCGRYDRVEELLSKETPRNSDECIQILKDKDVMMGITVQQMVFDNSTGDIVLVKV